MSERALITGGAGFIGIHLARVLLSRAAEVTLVDNFSRGVMDQELRALLNDVNLIECDLTNPLANDVLGDDYTQIYHLAAIVGVRSANEFPHRILRVNLLALINVLDWCVRTSSKASFCFASSSEVYAESVNLKQVPVPTPEAVPLMLTSPGLPRFSYGTSKATGEIICVNYARAFGFPLRIVRYHNVYGPRMGYDHVISEFIHRLFERQNPFSIYGAYQSRAFCYVSDAIEATIRLMSLPTAAPQIVNVGNDREETRISDLARMLFELANFYPEPLILPAPPGSPERRSPKLEHLRQLTSYEPSVDLRSGLKQTYDWYLRNREQRKGRSSAADT